MLHLLNTPGTRPRPDEAETVYLNKYGIGCLNDISLDSTLQSDPGCKSLPQETVCVVDDDPLVLNSVSRLLESAGVRVITFSEPRSFLEHVSENPVPLAILDIWMEEMTGMELLAHLCAKSPATRVIFMSAREDSAAKATVMQAGALAFFIKPFNNDRFLTAVRCALDYSLHSMQTAVRSDD